VTEAAHFIPECMKRLVVLIVIFVRTISVFTQEKPLYQECSPTFKDVFDFQVGNFFRYEEDFTNYSGDWFKILTTESYNITGREVYSDTLIYTRKGKRKKVNYKPCVEYAGHYCYNDWEILSTKTYIIDDTITYIDSLNHFLNKCADSLINVKLFVGCCDTIFTRIQIEENGTIIKKTVGGENNFYIYDSIGAKWDTLFWLDDPNSYLYNFNEVYAKGLGLFEKDYGYFEGSDIKTLTAYIKGTDTFGIITSIPENTLIKTECTIYPNPVINDLNIRLEDSFFQINIYNSIGELLYSKPVLSDNTDLITIYVGEFKKGLYLVELIGKNKFIAKFEKL
jgi:hypothetical protein